MKGGQRFRSRVGWHSCAAAGGRGTRPFAKNAKERGTQCVADATEFKGRATRPVSDRCDGSSLLHAIFLDEPLQILRFDVRFVGAALDGFHVADKGALTQARRVDLDWP